jgi:hypothetical protein
VMSISKYFITTATLVSLFFVFPADHAQSAPGDTLVFLLLASAGILLSRVFVLSSDRCDKIGIEPAVIVCLATWNCTDLIYPTIVVFTFAGSIFNAIRTEIELSSQVPEAIFQGVSFALLLRISSFFYWHFLTGWASHGAAFTYLAMVALVLPVSLLRTLSVRFSSSINRNPAELLKKSMLSNTFLLLLVVPGALTVLRRADTTEVLITYSAGVFSMLLVHVINLILNRTAHEKTDQLETVLKLKELSGDLFSAVSEMDALRTLCKAVSSSWDCRAAVKWKNLTYFEGECWDTENAVSMEHSAGLRIWVDSFSSTIPQYLEAFLNRAVPVLSSLEAEKRMQKTSWESMETMISFVERNNSEFAGFSRRVAVTAAAICREMDLDRWFEDCIRLAGLIHMINIPSETAGNETVLPHSVPEITLQALEWVAERWNGTGPSGKLQEEIPLPARILAVSIAWEKAMESGTGMAVRDMKMRAGTLYDPGLAELVIHLNR